MTSAVKRENVFSRFINRTVRYFQQTRAELRKVTWPSRREAVRLTAIVLGVTITMAAFLGLVDYLFTLLFELIIK